MFATASAVLIAALVVAATAFSLRGRPIGERLLYGLGFGAAVLGAVLLLTDSSTDPGNFFVAAAVSLGFASLAEAIRKKH